jgi:hypothetical protein
MLTVPRRDSPGELSDQTVRNRLVMLVIQELTFACATGRPA